jgi:hypothetical protein
MLAVDFEKEIRYSRITRDFDLYIDGQYVGSRSSYHEAEVALDEIILDKLTHGDHLTATQLDGGDPEAVNWSIRDIPDEPPPDDAPGSDDENGTPHAQYSTDACPSCGAQLDWQGPGLCAVCWEASKVLPAIRWLRPKHYQRFALHIGRSHRRRTRRSRKTQLAYLLMRYRVNHCIPPLFLRADFAARKGL